MLTHVLDTSAWIAHLQNEAAGEVVGAILADPDNQGAISVLSLVELHGRLKTFNRAEEFPVILGDYQEVFAQIVPVNEAIALHAISLREAASARVPTIDSLIAATAAHHNATLVHRDPHFAGLPENQPRQLTL